MSLNQALTQAAAAVTAARAAPLSSKRAWLAALLLDQAADTLYGGQGEDILAFRESLAKQSEALALVFALAARELDLVTEAVEVPVRDYPNLGVEDFMVSLYNGRTVQRVLIALKDGARRDVHEVLAGALAFLAHH